MASEPQRRVAHNFHLWQNSHHQSEIFCGASVETVRNQHNWSLESSRSCGRQAHLRLVAEAVVIAAGAAYRHSIDARLVVQSLRDRLRDFLVSAIVVANVYNER